MGWFQLDPAAIVARSRAAGKPVTAPSLGASVGGGVLGFALVSLAGFAPWALFGRWFHRHLGEAGLYAVCALVFIGLSGLLLHWLIIGPGSLPRFYKLFSLAFAAYSIAWIIGWMTLRGHLGGIVGLLAGTALMGWMLATAFDARGATLKVIAALFLLNAAGYFVGGWVEGAVIAVRPFTLLGTTFTRPAQITLAQMLWGVCYGLGLGAGLGLAFYLCQAPARALLAAKAGKR